MPTTAAAIALLLAACTRHPTPRPPAPVAEIPDDLPAIAPADTPWPPASYDARHWVGGDRSTFRPFSPRQGAPVSLAGCPFAPAPVPPCPRGVHVKDAENIIFHRDELLGRVVTFTGGLCESASLNDWRPEGDGTSTLLVDGIWFDGSKDRSHPSDRPHPFRCMGTSFACCGIERPPRVVVRGRLATTGDKFPRWYVDAPLVCAVGETVSLRTAGE